MNKAQMALLVRWWKQKFMSGYKQISAVMPEEDKCSDTEQLLKRCPPEGYSNWTSDRESLHTNNPNSADKINLKELECGISVDENTPTTLRDRQEFSFTLYDFDGHGKITKDDIAGLVTTIYETVGSSIKVPQYGSKTIKVKLTVSPGRGAKNNEVGDGVTVKNGEGTVGNNGGISVESHRREMRRGRVSGKRGRRQYDRITGVCQKSRKDPLTYSGNIDDRHCRLFDTEDNQSHPRLSPPSYHQHHANTLQAGSALNCGCCGRTKKRSSSLQRQELLKIIQANMEKNNLSFQTSRKQNVWNQQNKDKSTPAVFPYLCKSKIPVTPPVQPTPLVHNNSPQMQHSPHLPQRSSSHHHKHRHREAEQARAMAQVVKWLEQQFSSSSNPTSTARQESNSHSSSTIPPKNEHYHHIHEHVHHHYHHYRDSPVPV